MLNGSEQQFGEPLSDFSLSNLTGSRVTLSSRLVGKKGGLVVIWSSTCSHCLRYDSYFNDFEARNPDLSLTIVSARNGETMEAVRMAAAQRRLTCCIVHDPMSSVAKQWFTQQTPKAFLLDPERRLFYRGAVDNYKYPEDPEHVAYLAPAIDEYLAGKPISRPDTPSYGCAIQSVYYNLPRVFIKGV